MKRVFFSFLILVITTFGCASSHTNLKLVSKTPAKIYSAQNAQSSESAAPFSVAGGEAFELKSPVSRIEAEGYQPILIAQASDDVIARSAESPVEVSMKAVDDWKSTTTEAFVTKEMDSLYLELLKILDLARKSQVKEALGKADKIIQEYPKLASAYYVKAQVEILNGNQNKAYESLNAAVSLKPEFKEAITLRDQIQKRGIR